MNLFLISDLNFATISWSFYKPFSIFVFWIHYRLLFVYLTFFTQHFFDFSIAALFISFAVFNCHYFSVFHFVYYISLFIVNLIHSTKLMNPLPLFLHRQFTSFLRSTALYLAVRFPFCLFYSLSSFSVLRNIWNSLH